jgi:hypothetical protein
MSLSRPRLTLLAGAVLCLLAGAALAWARNPSHEQRLSLQPRANAPSARIDERPALSQTFRAPAANLSGIELLAVLSQPIPAESSAIVTLTLERTDDPNETPLTVTRSLAGLRHNDPLRFDFVSLPDSQAARYRLTLTGSAGSPLAVWATAEESYAEGELLSGDAPQPGDLHLTLYTRYTLRQAVGDALRLSSHSAPALLALALLLWLPGLALALWLLPRPLCDPFGLAGLSLGLGLAVWPLLFLWLTVLGGALSAGLIWTALSLSAGAVAWRSAQLRRRRIAPWRPGPGWGAGITLLALLGLGFALRAVQTRALLTPNWVDGYHHTVLAQLMADTGRLPASGEPYVQMSLFHYHFGFHATAAALAQWIGAPPYQAVLWLGCALNTLAALTVYGLTTHLTGCPWAGVIGAAVATSISYMPAYYASWGRYTQLTGLVMLAPLWVLTEQLLQTDAAHGCGHRSMQVSVGAWHATPLQSTRVGVALGVLAAGLALTHYRVLAFYAVYVALRLLAVVVAAAWARRRGGPLSTLADLATLVGGALLTTVLVAPWAWRLVEVARSVVPDVYGGWQMPAVVQDPIPTSLLKYGWTPQLLAVAGLGALWALVRRQRALIVLALWCAALLLLANPQVLGIAKVWFISNGPVIISYWLPCAVLVGWLVADLGERLARRVVGNPSRIAWHDWLSAVLAVGALSLAGWGAWRTVDVVNATTVLVKPEDVEAMDWAREHTPPEARFLINTRPWMNEVRMGADGGWWLPLLAERATSLPSILYTQGPPAYRQEIQDLAAAVEAAPELSDPALLARLDAARITHVYLGALPGPMTAQQLDRNPALEALYVQGPVRIYALKPPPR